MFETMTNGVKADEVNRALQRAFSGNGPQVVLQADQSPEGTVADREVDADNVGRQRFMYILVIHGLYARQHDGRRGPDRGGT
ncbi:hypothetical protein ACC695_39020, partial [Rhizobium ruizarguesonis]